MTMVTISRHIRKKPYLNLTPLIDVIFLLIVFFMLTSRFSLDTVLDVGLAKVSEEATSTQLNKDDVLLILLDEHGRFKFWGRDGVGESRFQSMAKLSASLKPILIRNAKRQMIIVVNEKVNVQQAMNTLEAVKHAGAVNVRLVEGE